MVDQLLPKKVIIKMLVWIWKTNYYAQCEDDVVKHSGKGGSDVITRVRFTAIVALVAIHLAKSMDLSSWNCYRR